MNRERVGEAANGDELQSESAAILHPREPVPLGC
jgi:hypothetical protein